MLWFSDGSKRKLFPPRVSCISLRACPTLHTSQQLRQRMGQPQGLPGLSYPP